MKIQLFRGKDKPQYTLYISADRQITDLPLPAQQAITAIGDRTLLCEKDFTGKTDTFSKEVMEKVKTDGAYFTKWAVEFKEITDKIPA